MSKIIPKLDLHDVHDTELVEYAQDKEEKINVSPEFAGVNPSAATVTAKRQEYFKALVKADEGTKADTSYKKQKRTELENLLTLQAQHCARIADGNLSLYLTTGYEAKNTKGNPLGHLPAVTGLTLYYGDNPGEIKAKWNSMPDALNFTVWIYSDINNPDGSMMKEFIIGKLRKKKTTLSGLPSGQIVFVRARANGGNAGNGAWSDVSEKRVP